jgi:hypothetical protein
MGLTSTAALVLKNSGARATQVNEIRFEAGASAAFSIVAGGLAAARTLQPGGEIAVTVRYAPTSTAEARAILAAVTPSGSVQAVLTNLPPSARIQLEPSFVDFGIVSQGQRAQREVKIRNVGTAPLTVRAIAKSAATPADFAVDLAGLALPVTLDMLQVRTFQVAFSPSAPGGRTGGVEIASNDTRTPIATLPLSSGDSTARISIDPSELRFGAVEQGQEKALTVRVTNAGTADLRLSPSLTGSSDFRVTAGERTVAPNAFADLAVIYAPSDPGADRGTLVLSHNDPHEGPVNVPLTGGAEPSIAFSPYGIQFSNVAQFSTVEVEVVVSNTGYGDLVLGTIAFGTEPGESNPDYTLANVPALGTRLARGRTARFTVRYAKTTVGNPAAVVYVASNDPDPSKNPFPLYVVAVDGIADPPPVAVIQCTNCNGSTIEGTPPLAVELDGSGSSDPQDQALLHSWSLLSIPAGSQAVVENPTAVRTRFTADVAGPYRVALIVQDASGQLSPRATKDITIVP